MKFGLALPNSGPIAGVDAICRVAELAEAAGFDALLVHDHIHYDTEWLGHRTSGLTQPHADIVPDLYESLITLAWVARATTTVRLATAVLVLPLRDPRVLARQLVTLQALSRGRLTLGVGSGDYPGDYRVMEIEYRRKAALTRDYLDALVVATIRARLAQYRDAGVHAMNLRCFADDEAAYFATIQRFADEIMPAFAAEHRLEH